MLEVVPTIPGTKSQTKKLTHEGDSHTAQWPERGKKAAAV